MGRRQNVSHIEDQRCHGLAFRANPGGCPCLSASPFESPVQLPFWAPNVALDSKYAEMLLLSPRSSLGLGKLEVKFLLVRSWLRAALHCNLLRAWATLKTLKGHSFHSPLFFSALGHHHRLRKFDQKMHWGLFAIGAIALLPSGRRHLDVFYDISTERLTTS